MADTEVPSTHVSPQADVVFVIGTPPKVKMFVNSIILIRSSKVFAALLGPNFREGQGTGSAQPKEIPLPDDNLLAMSMLCNLLHNNHEVTSRYMSMDRPKKLISLVAVADKYGCAESLCITTRALLLSMLNNTSNDVHDLWGIASLAYTLKDSVVFTESTKRLIQDITESYFAILDNDPFQMLPPIVLYAIEAKRTRGRAMVTYGLANMLAAYNVSAEVVREYTEYLRSGLHARQWPPIYDGEYGASISWCANALDHFDDFGDAILYDNAFHEAASDLREECEGLCMDCVRGGVQDLVSDCDGSHGSK